MTPSADLVTDLVPSTPDEPRAFAVQALKNFAACLDALAPDAWDRIAARCADFDSTSFEALVARADRLPELLMSKSTAPPLQKAALTAVLTSAGVIRELAVEFKGSRAPAFAVGRDRVRAQPAQQGTPLADAFMSMLVISEARRPDHPGVAVAILAAGIGILMRRRLDVIAAYAPFEPEIPLASLGGSVRPG